MVKVSPGNGPSHILSCLIVFDTSPWYYFATTVWCTGCWKTVSRPIRRGRSVCVGRFLGADGAEKPVKRDAIPFIFASYSAPS